MPASASPLTAARLALAAGTPIQRVTLITWCVVVGYGVVLLGLNDVPSPLAAAVGVALAWLPAVLATVVAFRRGRRAAGARLAAAALVSFCVGLTLNGLLYVSNGTVTFPAAGDRATRRSTCCSPWP